MVDVLQYCDNHYDTVILFTAQPELYEPFGFREVGECRLRMPWCSGGGRLGFRELNLSDLTDLQLTTQLLETREPVSHTVGVVNETGIFGFNEGNRPLRYMADLEVIVCFELDGACLKLFDVVGPRLCTLDDIIKRIPQPIDEVEFYISPDRFEVKARPESHLFEGNSHLMVRGDFTAEGEHFMIPRSARC